MKILVVDDDPQFKVFLETSLKRQFSLKMVSSLKEAFVEVGKGEIDVVLLDVHLGVENSLEALNALKAKDPKISVVMVSGTKDPHFIVEAIQKGAQDYLVKPFDIEELLAILEKIKRHLSLQNKNQALLASLNENVEVVVGKSKPWREILTKVQRVKGHETSILIEGESGTGKEILARLLHYQENNKERPFIAVNCAAIPDTLLESELFGHEKGAFTGALTRKIGKFELAQGGDLFLDEISSLTTEKQAKLLRALQEKEICRVGGEEIIKVNFRLIAASNEDLEKLVSQKKFRQDLYHRLRVIHFKIPPLRERLIDLPLLADHFLKKYDKTGKYLFNDEALEIFSTYAWPGNIRELENVIHSLVVLSPETEIKPQHLPDWLINRQIHPSSQGAITWPENLSEVVSFKKFMDKIEKSYIQHVLKLTGADKSKAADILKMGRTSLYKRLNHE